MSANPLIEPTNYFEGYNKNIDELKNRPEIVELDKLCYDALEANETGKKLLETLEKRFLYPGLARPGQDNYSDLVKFYEGFKECIRTLKACVEGHKQRIEKERMV